MRFFNDAIFKAVDISVSQNSAPIDASYLIALSVQAVTTGTAVGTLKLQYSNDAPSPSIPTHWSDITGATVAIAAAGTYSILKIEVSYQWIRLVYTTTSDTGACTARIKSVGF